MIAICLDPALAGGWAETAHRGLNMLWNATVRTGLAALVFIGCNAPEGDALYSNHGPFTDTGRDGSVATTGGAVGTGGFGGGAGGDVSTGGTVIGGGGGNVPGTGGVSQGSGGQLASGGSSSGGSGGGPFDVTKCNFTGAWASYVQIPVHWPQTLVLYEGDGVIEQWGLTLQEQVPGSAVVKARTYQCAITLPDLQSNFFQANAKFGIRFPETLFDRGVLPHAEFEIRAAVTNLGIELVSEQFALVAGLKLDDAAHAAWPTAAQMTLADDDNDGAPGIRVVPTTADGYALPPGSSNPFDTNRAALLDIALRTVQSFHGPIDSCDKLGATFDIATLAGKPSIDSTVVGCVKQQGGNCSPDDAAFIDTNRPQFASTGSATLHTQRMPDGSACPEVRKLYPPLPVAH